MAGFNNMGMNMYGNSQQFQPQSFIQPTIPTPMNQFSSMPNGMLPGRVVKSEQDIGIGEVPMDGMIHLFPTEDYSHIYVKVWDNSGELKHFTFVQEDSVPAEIEAKVVPITQQQEILDMFNDRFDSLERLIKRNNKPYNKNYKKPYNKNNQNGSSNREDSE